MKKFLILVIIVMGQSASAGKLFQLNMVQCTNSEGSFLNMNIAENKISAQLQEFPFLSNEFIQEKQELTKYTWVPGKLYGFGGLAGSKDEKFTGLVTLLFEAAVENSLAENETYRVHYADIYGRTTLEKMDCKLSFNTNNY